MELDYETYKMLGYGDAWHLLLNKVEAERKAKYKRQTEVRAEFKGKGRPVGRPKRVLPKIKKPDSHKRMLDRLARISKSAKVYNRSTRKWEVKYGKA